MKRSPQLEHGFIRYAHELDAALAYADFTKGARIVLREVFAQIYGPAQLKTAKVSPTVLANLYGSDKGTFGRSIKELTDSGALVKIGKCEYRFNKDYAGWEKNGHPRLSEKEMELALKAGERAMSHKQSSVGNTANTDKLNNKLSVGSSANMNQSNHQASVGSSANGSLALQPTALALQPTPGRQFSQRVVGASANGSHYIERARSETGRDLETDCVVVGGAGETPDDCPEMPPDDGPLLIMRGSHPMGREDAENIWRKLWRGWGSETLCAQFFEHQQWYPAELWRMAISQLAASTVRPRGIGLFEAKCEDIRTRGVRSAPPATTESAATTAREPPRPRHRNAPQMTPEQRQALRDSLPDIESEE